MDVSFSQFSNEWQRQAEVQYVTYVQDENDVKITKKICWLYVKNDALFCRLCEKHQMKRSKNGKENFWATTGVKNMSFQRVKMHQNDRIHADAQLLELSSSTKNSSKSEVKNALIASIYLSQEDLPFDRFDSICKLMEKTGVKVRLDNDASNSIPTAIYLHEIVHQQLRNDLLEKVKTSSVLGWLMHQGQSKTGEKLCLVYVRYFDKFQVKTNHYATFRIENDESIKFLGHRLIETWKTDDLNPMNSSCFFVEKTFATEISTTFNEFFEKNSMKIFVTIQHEFSLLGDSMASLFLKKFESIVGQIYDFIRPIKNENFRLKNWKYFLDLAELENQNRDEIRWSFVFGSMKPILNNIRPGCQGLWKIFNDFQHDFLLEKIFDDAFLVPLHFLHDVHESILGPLMKLTQTNKTNLTTFGKIFEEKRDLIDRWLATPNGVMSPALTNFLESSRNGRFGSLQINIDERDKSLKIVRYFLKTLRNELSQRFAFQSIEEDFLLLFDPENLIANQKTFLHPDFGRENIENLRKEFESFPNFNSELVLKEWIHFKPLIKHFLEHFSLSSISEEFWKDFLRWQNSTNKFFLEQFQNILFLLKISLVTQRNFVECSSGFSIASRIPTVDEFPLMFDFFNLRLNVRMLFKFDIETDQCDQFIDRIVQNWNRNEFERRLDELRILIEQKTNLFKRKSSLRLTFVGKLKCANGCQRFISTKSTEENGVTSCSHNNLLYQSFDQKFNCSRRLCRSCRLALKLKPDELWFCDDHVDLSNEN